MKQLHSKELERNQCDYTKSPRPYNKDGKNDIHHGPELYNKDDIKKKKNKYTTTKETPNNINTIENAMLTMIR
jgi:hypothetical protein